MWMIDEPLLAAVAGGCFVSVSPRDIASLLFVSQCRRGIDRGGAARGEVACGDADQAEDRRRGDADLPREGRPAEEAEDLVALDREEARRGDEERRDDDPEEAADERVDE